MLTTSSTETGSGPFPLLQAVWHYEIWYPSVWYWAMWCGGVLVVFSSPLGGRFDSWGWLTLKKLPSLYCCLLGILNLMIMLSCQIRQLYGKLCALLEDLQTCRQPYVQTSRSCREALSIVNMHWKIKWIICCLIFLQICNVAVYSEQLKSQISPRSWSTWLPKFNCLPCPKTYL